MKNLLKPYNLLLYLLAILTFFFLGIAYAILTHAAENQGLAGGAIVLGYGVISSFFGLFMALFVASKSSKNNILRINKILGIIVIGLLSFSSWRYYTKTKQEQEIQQHEIHKQTSPATQPMAMLVKMPEQNQENKTMGLGMFSPNMYENKALYFYGKLNLEKSLTEHSPTDSITFKKSKYRSYEIVTAPPWLVPDHLKLDYDMFYFKVVSVTDDFLELIVNTYNKQTAFVSKRSGTLKYWPEFLLGVNSVEFLNPKTQKIYVKPLDYAGTVNQSYSFMRPLKVRQDWMYVLLLDESFQITGKGWIKWQENNKLLIKYNLLS